MFCPLMLFIPAMLTDPRALLSSFLQVFDDLTMTRALANMFHMSTLLAMLSLIVLDHCLPGLCQTTCNGWDRYSLYSFITEKGLTQSLINGQSCALELHLNLNIYISLRVIELWVILAILGKEITPISLIMTKIFFVCPYIVKLNIFITQLLSSTTQIRKFNWSMFCLPCTSDGTVRIVNKCKEKWAVSLHAMSLKHLIS